MFRVVRPRHQVRPVSHAMRQPRTNENAQVAKTQKPLKPENAQL